MISAGIFPVARVGRALNRLCGVVLITALAGCATPRGPSDVSSTAADEIMSECCEWNVPYSDWAVDLADANSETLRHVGEIQLRSGYLPRHPKALAIVEKRLEPMDLVFMHSENRVSGLLIPGQFTHGAVYLGTEAQLRAAGLWSLPELAPYRDQIAAGEVFLEAVDGGVRLAGKEIVLNTDAVVALRPMGMNRKVALKRGLAQMGVPFDMRFDVSDPSELFCAELISLMYPDAKIPHNIVPGRETILIDAIVAGAVSGDLPFAPVVYVEATANGGSRVLSKADLAQDIRREWPGVQTN
ncbi:MAG: YiiX/YebB-like N1pC/P60 family cysteine hydrolase [Marinosulfonomonas sp.]